MAHEDRKPVLPILSYYLTFIHYFGFSINPNDEANSRYLSIRVKRAAAATTTTTVSKEEASKLDKDQQQQQRQQRLQPPNDEEEEEEEEEEVQHLPDDVGPGFDQWLASYRWRAQRTFGTMTTRLLIGFLRTSIKFTAITFTTFIAVNHCIVLADYIYQGSKVFLELMLEVRLVITKFSALIFVLSWHFNQTKVRQLIKLVKSTSIYIIGTQSTGWLGLPISTRELSSIPRDRKSPVNNSNIKLQQNNNNNNNNNKLNSLNRRRQEVDKSSENHNFSMDADDDLDDTNAEIADGDDDDFHEKLKSTKGGRRNSKSDEIGNNSMLMININYMDSRHLKWWIMCVFVTILHFGLSEAELTKCHHLWQWLDDYSMHQLNNQTISNSTLMLLASFDNYIYTVHVYGTRLIGASIICIVCSMQRENIVSLRWHVLKLIRADGNNNNNNNKNGDLAIADSFSIYRRKNNNNNRCCCCRFERPERRQKSWEFSTPERTRQDGCRKLDLSESGFSADDDDDDNPNLTTTSQDDDSQFTRSCQSKSISTSSSTSVPRTTSSCELGAGNGEKWGVACVDCSGGGIDRNLFFVLGESDWLRVRENARISIPSGYLSSTLYRKTRLLTRRLSNLRKILWLGAYKLASLICVRLSQYHGNIMIMMKRATPNQIGFVGAAAADLGEKFRQQQNGNNNHIIHNNDTNSANLPIFFCRPLSALNFHKRVTPTQQITPTNNPPLMTSLDQIASFIMFRGGKASVRDGGGGCGNSLARPTPNNRTEFLVGNDNVNEKIGAGKTTARRRRKRILTRRTKRKDFSSLFTADNRQVNHRCELFVTSPLPPLRLINASSNVRRRHNSPAPAAAAAVGFKGGFCSPLSRSGNNDHSSSGNIEWELERLASKYELVRTVNARIDSCFGPMLLIQFSFLFLMSCIDVVYFSICFNPNTKTKYIIISGMILLWWPYLLLYKFASDINLESKELLACVRRLARLWLLKYHSSVGDHSNGSDKLPSSIPLATRYSPLLLYGSHHDHHHLNSNLNAIKSDHGRSNRLTYNSNEFDGDDSFRSYSLLNLSGGTKNRAKQHSKNHLLASEWPFGQTKSCGIQRQHNISTTTGKTADNTTTTTTMAGKSSSTMFGRRACIINKLDHVFKPTYLSIMGIMTVDKFFLLNFAKIVITASVMVIQFIT